MATSKQNIAQIIEEIARQNINSYREDYPMNGDEASMEAAENLQELAKGYWDNRTEDEVERDEKVGVTMYDYVEYVHSAFRQVISNEE